MRDLLASSSQGVWPAPGTVLSTGSDHACACSCSGDASTHSIYQASSWMIIRRWCVSHSLHCVALRVCAKPNARRAERPELKMTQEGARPANYELRRVHACILWYGGGGGGAAAHRRFVPAVGPARRPSILLTN